MIKQVICVRTDLNMRKGKMCAQVAHASMKVFFDLGFFQYNDLLQINLTPEMVEWFNGLYTKVVLKVNSEKELYDLNDSAYIRDIPHAVVIDAGITEFHGVHTPTCIAIGPDESSKIDKITGHLELL